MERFAALGVRPFRHLAAAYIVNEFGTWIGDVALAILVFDRTGSPLATALLFVALRFAPGLIGPLVTTRVEVISPRQILSAVYLAEALIFGLLAVLAQHFSLPLVLLLAALDGVLAVVAKSLIRSVNAAVLGGSGLLRQGIAIINLGVSAGGALGPLLAGLLVANGGPGVALGVDAASFAVVAVIIGTARGLRLQSDTTVSAIGRLRSALGQAWGRPPVRRLLLGTAMTLLFGAAVIPIEVVFAKHTLHAGDSGYGLLMAAWGAGTVAGGAAAAVATKARVTTLITVAVSLMAAGYAGLSVSPNLVAACLFSVLGGIGNGLWITGLLGALQEGTPEHSQAAVMSVFESINQVMPGLGYILGGVITDVGSPRIAYGVAAAGIFMAVIAQIVRPITGVEIRPPDTPLQQRSD